MMGKEQKDKSIWVTVSEKLYACMEREGTLLGMRDMLFWKWGKYSVKL
jgi:hypothetical protein